MIRENSPGVPRAVRDTPAVGSQLLFVINENATLLRGTGMLQFRSKRDFWPASVQLSSARQAAIKSLAHQNKKKGFCSQLYESNLLCTL